jgi:hypothetical protein
MQILDMTIRKFRQILNTFFNIFLDVNPSSMCMCRIDEYDKMLTRFIHMNILQIYIENIHPWNIFTK